MVNFAWVVSAFQFGFLIGMLAIWLVQKRKAPPVLRPYQAPQMDRWEGHRRRIEEELELKGSAEERMMVDDEEINSLVFNIMRETGVDEAQAREEVDLILAEANAIGQA